MSPIDNKPWNARRIVAVLGLVGVSIAAAFGGIYVSAFTAFAGKPIGRLSCEQRNNGGPVFNGEMWFVMDTFVQPSIFELWKVKSSRIKRLNLESGEESETGLFLEDESGWPLKIGDQLYLMTHESIYQAIDDRLVRLGPLISFQEPFRVYPFEMDGRITSVRRSNEGHLHLAHLIDGTWIDGRPILLPGPRRVWQDDAERKDNTLLPLTSAQPTLKATRGLSILEVVPFERQFYLVFTDIQLFGAYRVGFEFADESRESASALAPSNAASEVSGWHPINHGNPDQRWFGVVADSAGLLFSEFGRSQSIVRRNRDGSWRQLDELYQCPRLESPFVAVDTENAKTYVIYWNDLMKSAKICRVTGNQVQLPHAVAVGPLHEYLARWRHFLFGIASAWFVHITILAGSFTWLTRNKFPKTYEFAHRSVILASFGRRTLATSIDVALCVTILSLMWRVGGIGALATEKWTDELLAQALVQSEFDMQHRLHNLMQGEWRWAVRAVTPDDRVMQAVRDFIRHGEPLVVGLLVIGLMKVFIEARSGISPGKWIMGIRTVRSTLRPSGYARAVVRTILNCADMPLGLTPIPAFIAMVFSEHWQRLGDRVADTIVIRTV